MNQWVGFHRPFANEIKEERRSPERAENDGPGVACSLLRASVFVSPFRSSVPCDRSIDREKFGDVAETRQRRRRVVDNPPPPAYLPIDGEERTGRERATEHRVAGRSPRDGSPAGPPNGLRLIDDASPSPEPFSARVRNRCAPRSSPSIVRR